MKLSSLLLLIVIPAMFLFAGIIENLDVEKFKERNTSIEAIVDSLQ